MPYPQPRGLGSSITSWDQVSDAGLRHAETYLPPATVAQWEGVAAVPRLVAIETVAQQDGLLSGELVGGPLWVMVHEAIGVTNPRPGSISFADAIRRYPQLTGLFVAYEIYSDAQTFAGMGGDFNTPDKVLALATTRVSDQRTYQTSAALPDALSAGEAANYLAWVAHYLNLIYADVPRATADEHELLVGALMPLARQAAAAGGTTVLGNGVTVTTSLIRAQVECPDGTMFVVMDDVTGDPANRYVYMWLGPHWTPQAFGPGGGYYETSSGPVCVFLVPGTGSWYTARVFGQVAPGSDCDGTPPGFTGPWDLITPDMAAALFDQSGAPIHLVPPVQQVTHLPALSPGGSGGGIAPTPPVITQDENGNPISPRPTPIENTAPPAPVILGTGQPAPSNQVVTGTPLVPTTVEFTPSLLLVALVAGATYLMTRGGRR